MNETVWIAIIFYEFFQEDMFIYPDEFGMTKEEFIEENFKNLFVVREKIRFTYDVVFTKQYKHIFDKAIDQYFKAKRISKPDKPSFRFTPGRSRDDRLSEFLQSLGPAWRHKRMDNREFRTKYLESRK